MIKRRIYQLLLRMHPPAFRERFADEMLWLFDETLGDAGLFKLYTDAAYSLVKQHTANDSVPPSAPHLFRAVHVGTLSATRLFQAGAIASLAIIGFMKLLQPPLPLPQPPRIYAVRRYVPDICSGKHFASRSTGLQRIRRAHIKR
jgi:hypothetical protein